jgi:hypothetical protein
MFEYSYQNRMLLFHANRERMEAEMAAMEADIEEMGTEAAHNRQYAEEGFTLDKLVSNLNDLSGRRKRLRSTW